MTLTEQTKQVGDLLVHVESLEFCTKTVNIIRNPSANAVVMDDIVGFPLVAGSNGADYNLAVSGGEANVTALLLKSVAAEEDETIAATSNGVRKYQVLVRPPAILNQNKLATVDKATAAGVFVQATLRTRLAVLGYELRAEPTKYQQL